MQIQDPVFGRLTYERGGWVCVPHGADDGFMVSVEAPECGPSQVQRDIFSGVRTGLAELEQQARKYVASLVDATIDVSTLTVYSVEIGDDEESGRGWFVLELADDEAEVVHRVEFRGDEPVGYAADD